MVVEFTVEAEAEHAFDLWANRAELWWPKGHTMSGSDGCQIIFEGRSGGRVFERTPQGEEHEWGDVLDWEPPRRIRYLWHLFFDRSEATTVDVTFVPKGARTAVRIRQTGFELLGDAGVERRQRTGNAWAAITELYAEACGRGL
jgi:uncharacterized protein YndB with AHSA1/START domain